MLNPKLMRSVSRWRFATSPTALANESRWRANGRTTTPSAVGSEPIGTPTYLNCRVALRAIESLELAALSPPKPPRWNAARALALDRDGREERQQEKRRDGWSGETGWSRISAGQLILLACGLAIPLADLPGGP
jgi:hypothetical protein